MTPRILVIGCASLDTLHIGGRTYHTIGGAGLYTALAAHYAGAQAVLLGPKPDPIPPVLQPVAQRLTWLGPEVPLETCHAWRLPITARARPRWWAHRGARRRN